MNGGGNRRTKKAVLASIGLATSMLFCASLTFIDDAYASDANFNRRIYLGANIGMSQLDPDAGGIEATVDQKNDLGFGFSVGMDISNRISSELHANVLGTATLDPEGEIDYQVYGISALFYGLNAKESRERREGLSAYLRLGLDTMSNSATVPYELENKFSFVLGLGAEIGMSNGLAVRGELTRFYSDAYYGGVGLVYRFPTSGAKARAEQPFDIEMVEPSVDESSAGSTISHAGVTQDEDMMDLDTDGVLDDVDQCLGSRQNIPVNSFGCALFDGVIEGVTFEPASATLTNEAQRVLSAAASSLLSYPDIRVAILSHTDNQGDANLNLELSKKRAIAVVRYLLRQGVPLPRMRAEAYGEKLPIASNSTPEGRARNRRVEFKTITESGL